LLPLFCLLLFGTLDLARYAKSMTELSHAAHVGVMTAENTYNASGTPVTGDDVLHAVQTAYPGATVVPSVGLGTPVPANSTVTVQVSTAFMPITPFVRNLNRSGTITAMSQGRTLP
jgi:hypothetical protein